MRNTGLGSLVACCAALFVGVGASAAVGAVLALPATQDADAGGITGGRVLRGGPWRARLASPGGELPFTLKLQRHPAYAGAPDHVNDSWSAMLVNGAEEIPVPQVSWVEGRLKLALPHYNAHLIADPSATGEELHGEWLLDRGSSTEWLPFHARVGDAPRFAIAPAEAEAGDAAHDGAGDPAGAGAGPGAVAANGPLALSGRWAVQFAGDEDPAVGVIRASPDGTATGTFLTSTGDFRYLAGDTRASETDLPGSGLRLSCFDGAHAFLFIARRQQDGSLVGDFWSGANHHDTWTARRDDSAALPDAFDQVRWKEGARLDSVSFPDLDGVRRSLADPAFAGKARIVQIFGSWCPNCGDEAQTLAELKRRYGPHGLSIVGIAFERTGDFDKDVVQVRRFVEHRGVTWPVLVAGLADKGAAAAALGLSEPVKSFPTTIFLHRDGRIAAVHSGFAGPATGDAHKRQEQQFAELIETLLAEK